MLKHCSASALMVLVAIVACSFSACQTITPTGGMLKRETTAPQITGHQLRVMVNEFVVYSAHRIELRADEILAESTDDAIRKNALLWKINGISACFQAGSRNDPLGAYLDLWVLNRQMLHLSESAAGGALFGTWQSKVTEEYLELDKRLHQISHTVSSDLRLGEKSVDKFATDFPLRGLYFDREPVASRFIEEVQTPSTEVFQVVASLDNNIEELKKLTILYAEHLPKQARWEAELLLIETSQSALFQRPLQDFSTATEAIASIADTAQQLTQLVENERRLLGEMVTAERQGTIQDLEKMRKDTVLQLKSEREIVLTALSRERAVIFESLRQERLAVTSELSTKLSEALRATDTITQHRSNELVLQAPKVIDHFIWRALQAGLLGLSLLGLLATLHLHFYVHHSKHRRITEASGADNPFRTDTLLGRGQAESRKRAA